MKKWPPLKKAKMSLKWHFLTLCEIRAAWLGAFSIPGGTTGPGFKAEIRPPPFSSFFNIILINFMFYDLCILMFLHFSWIDKFGEMLGIINFWSRLCNVIRPYCNVVERFVYMSGRFTGEEIGNLYIRSPLCCPECIVMFFSFPGSDDGEKTQERRYSCNSRSPLCGFDYVVLFYSVLLHVGEITQGVLLVILSFSPLWNQNCDLLILMCFVFMHFVDFDFVVVHFTIYAFWPFWGLSMNWGPRMHVIL